MRTCFQQVISYLFLLVSLSSAQAGTQPKFLMTPLTQTHQEITSDQSAVVQYRVLNQTNIGRTLTLVPQPGITVITGPIYIAPHASSVMTLNVNAGTNPVIGGPKVCKTQGATDHPDLFLCSQPSTNNQLAFTRVYSNRVDQLKASPRQLTLNAGVPYTPGSITITNTSNSVTAFNVKANLTGTILEGHVIQNSSQCTELRPNQSCILTFTPGNTAIALTSFPIQGDNTRAVAASIQILPPTSLTTIAVSGSPLIVDAGSTGTLTVTNTGINAATGISTTLPNSLTAAGLSLTGNTCGTVLNPASTCTLTFTASSGATAVPSTPITIQGTNTDITAASIAIDVSTTASLDITAGSPLVLFADGTTTGTMTITNTGTTTVSNIVADFSQTQLYGAVTANTCTPTSIAPGASCTITFTPGYTTVLPTNFPMSSTTQPYATVTGNLTIKGRPMLYLSNGIDRGGDTSGTIIQPQPNPEILLCFLDASTGLPTSCENAGVSASQLANPEGISITGTNTLHPYAYIANYATLNGSYVVTQCALDQSTGLLGGCSETGTTFSAPSGIATNLLGSLAYIANPGPSFNVTGNTVSLCDIDQLNGAYTNCRTATNTSFRGAISVLLNPTNPMAYIANFSGNSISYCPTSGDDLTTCNAVPVNTSSPTAPSALALHPTLPYLYTIDALNGGLYKCPIGSGGGLSSCQLAFDPPTNGGIFRAYGLAINTAGTYLYLSRGPYTSTLNGLVQCPIASNATVNLNSCVYVSTAVVPSVQYGIALLNY